MNGADREIPGSDGPGAGDPTGGAAPEEPPGSRAARYRARRARRRAPWTATVAGALGVLIVVVVLYLVTSGLLAPASPGGNGSPAGITLTFGPPGLGAISCGSGAQYPTERLPVEALTRPFTTAQFVLEVIELGDGDILPTVTDRPQATLSAACAGAPPSPGGLSWYAVLVGGNGQNLATYTYDQSWAPVPGASFPSTVTNQSSFEFVLGQNLSGRGYGAVLGSVTSALPISGEGTL